MLQSRWGMGDITGQQIVGAGQSVASATVGILSANGTLVPMAASLSISVPLLGAIIGAGILAAGLAIDLIMNSGCGQTCIVSTASRIRPTRRFSRTLKPISRFPSRARSLHKRRRLSNFDVLWNWLQQPQQCGNPALGDAGKRCISDRQAGACTWTQPASAVPPWGTPPAGACWNWFNGYRDPIANDTNVYDDSSEVLQVINGTLTATPVVASGAGASTSLMGLPSWWPLAAAALLIGVGVMR